MTTQGTEGKIVGPLLIGGGQWNQLVDIAGKFAEQALLEMLPQLSEVGARVQLAPDIATKKAVAMDSNLIMQRETMVAFMCGFRLALAASVVEQAPDGTIRFQVEHPECRPTVPSA